MNAVMFDLDGTLLDTLEDLADSMNHSLRELDCPQHPYPFYRHAVGDGARKLAERSLPEDQREEQRIEQALRGMRTHYAENWSSKTRPYAGIQELLAALQGKQAKLAVLTNKPEEFAHQCVAHFLPATAFIAIRGARPDGALKPEPGGALDVIRDSGIAASDWLYVGDTNTDMQTAVAAGIFAVGCTWGFRDREELEQNGADAVIDTPAQLLPFYDSQGAI